MERAQQRGWNTSKLTCRRAARPLGQRADWRRRIVIFFFVTISAACPVKNAAAQKIYSVASLNTADQFNTAFEGFRARMEELGYREQHKIRYQYYNAKGNFNLLDTLAEKLVHDKVDLIVTSSTSATVAAAKATAQSRIPVLFLSAGNPGKLVKSYSGSGNNLAGISSASLELVEKRFGLLKELMPTAKRVVVPHYPQGINFKSNISETRAAAGRLGLELVEIEFTSVEDVAKGMARVNRSMGDAIFAPPDSLVTEAIDVLVNQAINGKMPLITSLLVNVQRGCLATYAADYLALGKQGAALADKILKGVNPGALPIEMPDKVNLVINLKTAKAIDLKISREMLLRADQIFE
ncbi:MAG: ABC transporter substrate-binding protein [Deltaproteobacteria bacterium]|nr:ABC transporter substrate-binding protein [Deltaproteobacteria bacterium]